MAGLTGRGQGGCLPLPYSPYGSLPLSVPPNLYLFIVKLDFPGVSDGKESACNAGEPGVIPGLGRFPGCRPGRTNFPGENRSSLSCRGAALSPRLTSCSPTPLGSQDPLKIWRPRTSLLGPLGESRNAGVRDPRLPTGAKFQLLGPRKERAPLVQREDSGGTESQPSPRSWSPSFQQFASGEIAK